MGAQKLSYRFNGEGITLKVVFSSGGSKTSSVQQKKCVDYTPFGVQMKERTIALDSSFSLRYSFQNQESDPEIKGEGNSINYKYRMHDPRVGRFFAVDPLAKDYPHNSPYAFSENVVINAVELEGREKDLLYYHDQSLNKWRREHTHAENEKFKKAFEKGKTIAIDQALDWVPIVGQIKAGITSIFGVNPVTGNDASNTDRAIATVGIIFSGLKSLGKINKALKQTTSGNPVKVGKTGEAVSNSASNYQTGKTEINKMQSKNQENKVGEQQNKPSKATNHNTNSSKSGKSDEEDYSIWEDAYEEDKKSSNNNSSSDSDDDSKWGAWKKAYNNN